MNKEIKKEKLVSNIFNKNINDKFRLVPFNIYKNYLGEPKYFPAASKEWKNKLYFFNYTSIKNLPVYNTNIDKIIRNYFNLYFLNVFLFKEFIIHKLKRLSLNKIYVSKPEIKHTNSKAILTIYVYNRERFLLLEKISKLKKIYKINF